MKESGQAEVPGTQAHCAAGAGVGRRWPEAGVGGPHIGAGATQLQLPSCPEWHSKDRKRRRSGWRQGKLSSTWAAKAAPEAAPLGHCMHWPRPGLVDTGIGCPGQEQVGLGPMRRAGQEGKRGDIRGLDPLSWQAPASGSNSNS